MAGTPCGKLFRLEESSNDPVEAGPTLEFLSFESTESNTPLSHHVYRTFFRD